MAKGKQDIWLAGVDGCAGGWVVVFVRPKGEVQPPQVFNHFAEILSSHEAPVLAAVDIPIGLLETSEVGGRAPEPIIRPKIGRLYRSVFRVPCRPAVYGAVNPKISDHVERFAKARTIERETSKDNKAFSKQCICICPKIVQVDELLRAEPHLVGRVLETHPELAFWKLNGESPLDQPKKIKRKLNPKGLALRRRLLLAEGLPTAAANAFAAKGVGDDDVLDALACAAIARRKYHGLAQPFPGSPRLDDFQIPMAIWA